MTFTYIHTTIAIPYRGVHDILSPTSYLVRIQYGTLVFVQLYSFFTFFALCFAAKAKALVPLISVLAPTSHEKTNGDRTWLELVVPYSVQRAHCNMPPVSPTHPPPLTCLRGRFEIFMNNNLEFVCLLSVWNGCYGKTVPCCGPLIGLEKISGHMAYGGMVEKRGNVPRDAPL
ncbi:hypothetical protein BDN72DRAFT_858174 [Pluteus cervinus]|uniref:Uncharacterized protein n=1 Tax=Pluteus cervinus TaxID=181527 RepID=A0ACD3AT30_9AGAR|nr:hypothetical protein BDN72DRAFT_858174 [Pluteus cervinus]